MTNIRSYQASYMDRQRIRRKIWMMMRLTILLLLVSTMTISAKSYSQKVNITATDVSVENVLRQIREQTGSSILWGDQALQNLPNISVSLKDTNLKRALKTVLKNLPVSYIVLGNVVYLERKQPILPEVIKPEKSLEEEIILLQEIIGTVSDSVTGEPLAGVTIRVKGTTTGTVTDGNGKFSLEAEDDAVLEVSFVGFSSQEIHVNGRTSINIFLSSSATGLDQLVVVGYGTQRKADITGAISNVTEDEFSKSPATDAGRLIKGRIPGLEIVLPSGDPTAGSQTNLRGVTTLNGLSEPLVLIDGVPGSLNSVSPENISSIDVLRDGSAAAIYGTRGTNGVILITTKSGTFNERTPKMTLNSYFSIKKINKRLRFMTPEEYRVRVSENRPGSHDYGHNTDWLNEVTNHKISQSYNLSIDGGGNSTNYFVNLDYKRIDGVINRTNNRLFYPSVNITHKMFNEKLILSGRISGYENHAMAGVNGGDVFKNAMTYNPTDPLTDDEGHWIEHTGVTDYKNPVALFKEVNGKNRRSNLRTSTTITYNVVSGLQLKLLGSRNIENDYNGYYETKEHYSTSRDGQNGFASQSSLREEEDMLEITGNYKLTISKDHSFTLLGGYSWIENDFQNSSMTNHDFPTDAFGYSNIGAGAALGRGEATQYTYRSKNKLVGFFGRINYAFKEKYLLEVSLRREGSSKFGANHKYGTFPAVSGGWNLAQENFLKDVKSIDLLKLRGGYGITGTEPIDPYRSLKLLNFNSRSYINGNWIQTANLSNNPNPNLRWEKKEESNIGLDFSLFNGRISGSLDYYKRTTKDLLFNYPVASPPYLFNNIFANAASMENKGIELGISSKIINSDKFSWESTLNFSHNKNELISLSDRNFELASGFFDAGNTGEPIQQPTHRVEIGQPIGNFWGFESIGVDENGRWIIMGLDGNPKPIANQTADDKRILGNGLPKTQLSWNNVLSYGNFDLSIDMRGAFGFQILNIPRMFYESPNMMTRGNLLKSAYDPVADGNPLSDNQELQYVSHYIENGDYWKIDNIILGYNWNFISNSPVKGLRIYASIDNLKPFTNYTGLDPEVGILGMNPGVDDKYRYPPVTTFSVGFRVQF